MNEVILCYVLVIGLALPLGHYMARSLDTESKAPFDNFFGPIEAILYRLSGVDVRCEMTWQGYAWAVTKLHVILILLAWIVFMSQDMLPLNPDGIPGMPWDTALHTAVSFATNTNQQHYSGQAHLSYLSQTLAVVTLQFITPATALAVLLAIARILFKKPSTIAASDGNSTVVSLGNYYRDLMRTLLRVMLPVAIVVALLLSWQGVPSTYQGAQTLEPLDSQVTTTQVIPLGPVASMVAIKQLGTNGGGWYGANSAVPLENPTPLSNMIETVSILLIPMALLVAISILTGRHKLMLGIAFIMLTFSIVSTTSTILSERSPNAAFIGLSTPGASNMEGKEVRFGHDMSALWASWTTQTSNGSVNAMHDSFNPLGGAITLMDMFVNVTFGGIGVGLIGYFLYLMLAAFIGSLMIGRAPEILGKPLEAREIRWISLAILAQPLVILSLTALTVSFPDLAISSNPGFHGLTQILYEYTSSFANNGSGFEGLADDSLWWNLTGVVALLIGRFLPLFAPLAIAAWLSAKRTAPSGRGSLDMESGAFVGLTAGVIVIVNLLGFLPVLMLGPVAEQLTLGF